MLEVTESTDLAEGSEADAQLSRLHAAGYRVAVDDFGTGFSNFARLEQLRPSLLKLDRSLVVRSSQGWPEREPAFVAAAAGIARSLGCAVVAEGVETTEQLAMVSSVSIPYVQGYLLGRPVPVHAWLGRAHPA